MKLSLSLSPFPIFVLLYLLPTFRCSILFDIPLHEFVELKVSAYLFFTHPFSMVENFLVKKSNSVPKVISWLRFLHVKIMWIYDMVLLMLNCYARCYTHFSSSGLKSVRFFCILKRAHMKIPWKKEREKFVFVRSAIISISAIATTTTTTIVMLANFLQFHQLLYAVKAKIFI